MKDYWDLVGFLVNTIGWELVGFLGNIIWFSRFAVQWIASERRKQVTIPIAFWWISILGCIVMTVYFLGKKEGIVWPGVLGSLPSSLIYARNIIIHKKNALAAATAATAALEATAAASDTQIVQPGKPGTLE